MRPTWKERYPLTPIESYVLWRREDGYHYDPWIRTHERLGAEILSPGAEVDDRRGTRERVGGVDELQFPEDGDYVVPGALVPVQSRAAAARMSSRTSGCGRGRLPPSGPTRTFGHGQAARRVDAGGLPDRIGRLTEELARRAAPPAAAPPAKGRIDVVRACENWVRGLAWDETFTQEMVEDELAIDERKAGQELGPLERERLIQMWLTLYAERFAEAA